MLKLKSVAIDTYKENVAYLHRDCPLYRSEGFQALMKIEIFIEGNGDPVLAILNIVDDTSIVKVDEIGLSEQAFQQLGKSEGVSTYIEPAEPPLSLKAVHRKISGEKLSREDFQMITRDILQNRYSKMEIAAFLVSSSHTGLDRDEIYYLTEAMANTGEKLTWGEPMVVDKHCIGGIPGNRTSMLIVPIVAAYGLLIPKTSSRAITSPAGTADTMEVLANVEIPIEEMKKIVKKERGMLTWGGTAHLSPVDDILISVERPLAMDSVGQMVASILSKKIAAGSSHLLLDIPIGPSAKIHQMHDAIKLKKIFEFVGDKLGLYIEVLITDGSQPIGNGIGPVLEARDVMQILNNDAEAPQDLKEKALQLAGRILEFDPKMRGGKGYETACDILHSGKALAKMQAIIKAQGAHHYQLKSDALIFEVKADKTGTVSQIDNLQMANIASLAGAPIDKFAGVDLIHKVGAKVKEGDTLYKIYATFQSDFEFARNLAVRDCGYQIASVI